MLDGIPPIPPPPGRERKTPPPRPTPEELIEFDIDDRKPVPLAIEDIPPGNEEKLDEPRVVPITDVGRGRNDNEEPPPIRPGMKPSVIPP